VTITPNVRDLALQVADALDSCQRTFPHIGAFGHALRLCGAQAAHNLAGAYWVRFHTKLQDDQRRHGGEFVRDRLLELANS
jgi:hypothetical protein